MDTISTAENRIAKEFFLDFTTGAEVSRKLYPNSFKGSRLPKRKNVGIVSNFFKKWSESGFIDSKKASIEKISKNGKKFQSETAMYRLNLNFFYTYLDKKLEKYKLTQKEKKFLDFLFSYKEVRYLIYSYNNLLDGIMYFLERSFINENVGEEYLKAFFIKYKAYDLKKDPEAQFDKFYSKLRNKIKIASKFEDYKDLLNNEEIRKYSKFFN